MSLIYALGKMGFQLGLGGGEGPSSGNPWMDTAMGLLGPVGDVIGLASRSAFTPSESWRDFGGLLQQTLGNEGRSLQNLIYAAANAKTREDLNQATQLFRHAVGGEGPEPGTGYVGGYTLAPGAANGAPQISPLPGATGTAHEWSRTADFGAPVDATNQLLALLYDQLPEGAATPLSQGAFDQALSEPEYGSYSDLTQRMIAGETPDLSAYRPKLRDLVTHSVDEWRRQQAAEQLQRELAASAIQL